MFICLHKTSLRTYFFSSCLLLHYKDDARVLSLKPLFKKNLTISVVLQLIECSIFIFFMLFFGHDEPTM